MSVQYTVPARLHPALLVCLPATLSIVAWFPDRFLGYGFLCTVAATSGFGLLLSQLGRDSGKRKEPDLWLSWGGKPTTQLLRHRDKFLDVNTKTRYHHHLAAMVPGITMPTADEEAANPTAADQVYDSCVKYLLQRTRDSKQFALLFQENVSYGFRRNLWAMRPAGIGFAIIGLIASSLATLIRFSDSLPAVAGIVMLVNSFILAWWLIRITPDWVRVPAFAYAQELLAACDKLADASSTSRQ